MPSLMKRSPQDTPEAAIEQAFTLLLEDARARRQRRAVLVSGSREWCTNAARDLLLQVSG